MEKGISFYDTVHFLGQVIYDQADEDLDYETCFGCGGSGHLTFTGNLADPHRHCAICKSKGMVKSTLSYQRILLDLEGAMALPF